MNWDNAIFMLFLKWTAVAFPAYIAVTEVLEDKKKFKQRRKWVAAGTAFCGLIGCYLIYTDHRAAVGVKNESESSKNEATAAKKELKEWQEDTTKQLAKIGAQGNDTEARRRYLEMMRIATANLNAATAPVEKYLTNQPIRQATRKQTKEMNNDVLAKQLIRIQPIYDLIEGRFDTWIAGLQRSGTEIRVEKKTIPSVRTISDQRGDVFTRTAIFRDDQIIYLKLTQGVIAEGEYSTHFRIELHVATKSQFGDFWAVMIGDDSYSIDRVQSAFSYSNFRGTKSEPASDEAYIKQIAESFDEVMTFLVDEASQK